MSARASSAMTLGARPPARVPMLSVLGPSSGSTGSGMRLHLGERVDEFVDGGFAQFGIGGVGHFAGGDHFVAQRAFGAERQAIFGGLAVDDVARAARIPGGLVGAGAVALFADDEEQAEIPLAGIEQRLDGLDHGGDDALGIAGAAAPDGLAVFAEGEEGRHGIDVGGERDVERPRPTARRR